MSFEDYAKVARAACLKNEDPPSFLVAYAPLPEEAFREREQCCWCDEPATESIGGDPACAHHGSSWDPVSGGTAEEQGVIEIQI